jgi:hypothetical protein
MIPAKPVLSVVILKFAFFNVMLGVVMRNVVLLSVVALIFFVVWPSG